MSCGSLRGEAADFFFITGADALSRMMSWQDAADLFKLAHFVGCTRPGHQLSSQGLPSDEVSLIEIPALSISSTECRERVAAGEPIWYLVPDGVVQYIAKRRLYCGDARPGLAWGSCRRPVPWRARRNAGWPAA